jgi:hypothetical protein
VFVHHDSNAWFSVCLKFESLKNKFEKNLKRKRENLLSSPLSRTGPLLLSARKPLRPAAFFPCARRRPALAQPAFPAGPAPPPPFSLLRLTLTGGTPRSGAPPTSSRGMAAPPIKAAGRFRPGQPLPRHQNLLTERSDAPSSFPVP